MTNEFAPERMFLRVGGAAALIGGIGGLITNALHPRPPERTEDLLTLVATMPHWTIIHYGAAVSAVFVVVAIALLVKTLNDPAARAIGEAGKYVTAVGAASFLVAIMIDGHGYARFASRWLEAAPDQKPIVLASASAVHVADAGLFPVWAGLFLGLGILLIAIAAWFSSAYSRAFAVVGMIGALMSLVYAVAGVFRVTVPLPLWPWGPAVETIWMIWLGLTMLRKSGPAAV